MLLGGPSCLMPNSRIPRALTLVCCQQSTHATHALYSPAGPLTTKLCLPFLLLPLTSLPRTAAAANYLKTVLRSVPSLVKVREGVKNALLPHLTYALRGDGTTGRAHAQHNCVLCPRPQGDTHTVVCALQSSVLRAGDPCTRVFYILSGRVDVSFGDKHVATLLAHDTFGHWELRLECIQR